MLVPWHRRTTDIMKTWFCPPGMSVVRHESLSQKTKLKLTPCRWPASGIRHGLQVDKTFTSSSNLQSWPKLTAVNNTSKSQDTKLFDLGVQKYLRGDINVATCQYFRPYCVLIGLLLMSFKCILVITQVGAMYHTYILLSSNLWGINHNYFVKKTIVIMKYYLHVGLIIHMKRNRTSSLWLGGLPPTTSGASLHPPETHWMVSLHRKTCHGQDKKNLRITDCKSVKNAKL